MKAVLRFVPLLMLIGLLNGCTKTGSGSSCDYDPCALKAPDTEVNAVLGYLSAQGINDATEHCSGLYYKIVTPGSGPLPGACSNVSVRYKGMFTSGAIFDQATTAEGISFNLAQLITGWKNGIPLVGAGGKINLYVPPSLGYGGSDIRDNAGNIVIPRNSVLIFEIELLSVR